MKEDEEAASYQKGWEIFFDSSVLLPVVVVLIERETQADERRMCPEQIRYVTRPTERTSVVGVIMMTSRREVVQA